MDEVMRQVELAIDPDGKQLRSMIRSIFLCIANENWKKLQNLLKEIHKKIKVAGIKIPSLNEKNIIRDVVGYTAGGYAAYLSMKILLTPIFSSAIIALNTTKEMMKLLIFLCFICPIYFSIRG